MAGRRLNKLTALQVRNAKTAGYFSDGGGLYLRVSDAGSRSWVFIYTRGGRRREMGLGPYPDTTLEEARTLALEQRKTLLSGDDPIDRRHVVLAEKKAARAKVVTFREAAEEFIEAQRSGWKNAKHAAQWESTLATYAFPVFGDIGVADIDTGLIMKVIGPIWPKKTETASRVRGRIEAILEWAKTREHRTGDNPARWHGHLETLLPKRNDVARIKHQPALPFEQMGEFMIDLRKTEGIAARALEFTILTASRSGEVRLAAWTEFDLEGRIWIVPAERMKARKEHRVPLSDPALELLRNMPRVDDSLFVFPGGKRGKPLSDMSLSSVIRRMNEGGESAKWVDRSGRQVVPHGFRSSFRDWTSERTSFTREVAEQALAHTIPSAVEASYRRGDLFEKRRKLMAQWASYCQSPGAGKVGRVVPIESAKAA